MPRPSRRPRAPDDSQLDLPQPRPGPTAARKPPVHLKEPDELARMMVARSYKPDASGKLRVPLTLFLERAVMERLHERAIKDGTSVAAMVEDLIRREASR